MEVNEKETGVAGTATPADGKPANTDTVNTQESQPAKDEKPKTGTATKGNKGQNSQAASTAQKPKTVAKPKAGQGAADKPETTQAPAESEAKAVADRLSVSELWENDKGEFFTSENLASLSVGGKAEKYKKHSF